MSTKALTYGDLPDSIHQTGPVSLHAVFLFCPKCGSRYSANQQDYFWQPRESKVTCSNGHRGSPMIVAREQLRIIQVKP